MLAKLNVGTTKNSTENFLNNVKQLNLHKLELTLWCTKWLGNRSSLGSAQGWSLHLLLFIY